MAYKFCERCGKIAESASISKIDYFYAFIDKNYKFDFGLLKQTG